MKPIKRHMFTRFRKPKKQPIDRFLLDDIPVCWKCGAEIRPDTKSCQVIDRARKVLVALDGDEAGGKSFWLWWSEHFPKARRWPVIGGKDPSEAAHAGLNLRDWVKAGI